MMRRYSEPFCKRRRCWRWISQTNGDVRVLEISTPRWSIYDAKALGIAPPDGVAATFQERAWSSPNWYTPPVKTATAQP